MVFVVLAGVRLGAQETELMIHDDNSPASPPSINQRDHLQVIDWDRIGTASTRDDWVIQFGGFGFIRATLLHLLFRSYTTPFNCRGSILEVNDPCNAVGDGIADDTAAVQNAANATPMGGTLYLPAPIRFGAITIPRPMRVVFGPGTTTITGPMTFRSLSGFTVAGQGVGTTSNLYATRLRWEGPAPAAGPSAMFVLRDAEEPTFRDFVAVTSTTFPLHSFIVTMNESGVSAATPGKLRMHNVILNGTNGGVSYGIDWANPSTGACTAAGNPWWCCTGVATGSCPTGVDANNDYGLVSDSMVVNFSRSAFRIGHAQSLSHMFRDTNCNAGATGERCVENQAGSFSWDGGSANNASLACFYINSPSNGYGLENGDSEGCDRFLDTGGPNKTFTAVSIRNWRIANDGVNADGRMIRFALAGPLIVEGNDFTGKDDDITFWLNGNATSSDPVTYGIARGNYIRSNAPTPFTVQHPRWERWITDGNTLRNGPSTFVDAPVQGYPDSQFAGVDSAVTGGQTRYAPIGGFAAFAAPVEADTAFPQAKICERASCTLTAAPNAGQNVTLTLQTGTCGGTFNDSSIAITIADAATLGRDTDSISINAGQCARWRDVHSATAANSLFRCVMQCS